MFIGLEIGFFDYASGHWLHHLRHAETQTSQSQAELLANHPARYLGLYKAFYNPRECLGYDEFWETWIQSAVHGVDIDVDFAEIPDRFVLQRVVTFYFLERSPEQRSISRWRGRFPNPRCRNV